MNRPAGFEIKVGCADTQAEAEALASAMSTAFKVRGEALACVVAMSQTDDVTSEVLDGETTAGAYSVLVSRREVDVEAAQRLKDFFGGWRARAAHERAQVPRF